MIYYLFLPIFALLLLVFQTTFLNLFFMGKIGLEISLIVVIYAGFYLDEIKGGILAIILGFFLDCISGSAAGIFTFFYVGIFFISKIISFRVYAESEAFIMIFTFFCALLEGLFIVLLYKIGFGLNIFADVIKTFLPQALIAGVLRPAVFTMLNLLERKGYGGESN
jgi:rod shape-determining protein MreD